MHRLTRYSASLILAAAMLTPLVGTGCEARVRVYDEYHRDYHRWDNREDHIYRLYLSDRHLDYREYNSLDHDHQRDYWNWRHDHPDGH